MKYTYTLTLLTILSFTAFSQVKSEKILIDVEVVESSIFKDVSGSASGVDLIQFLGSPEEVVSQLSKNTPIEISSKYRRNVLKVTVQNSTKETRNSDDFRSQLMNEIARKLNAELVTAPKPQKVYEVSISDYSALSEAKYNGPVLNMSTIGNGQFKMIDELGKILVSLEEESLDHPLYFKDELPQGKYKIELKLDKNDALRKMKNTYGIWIQSKTVELKTYSIK